MFKIILTLFLFIVCAHAEEFGNIHADPKAFRENFKARHSRDDTVGDIKASEIFDEDEHDDTYYWFSLHDYNHDGYLDGNELRYSWMSSDPAQYTKNRVEQMVDKILERDDLDNDGKISWEEYLSANNKN